MKTFYLWGPAEVAALKPWVEGQVGGLCLKAVGLGYVEDEVIFAEIFEFIDWVHVHDWHFAMRTVVKLVVNYIVRLEVLKYGLPWRFEPSPDIFIGIADAGYTCLKEEWGEGRGDIEGIEAFQLLL